MKLQTINTGSEGNCYILTDSNGESLIIEAGVRFSEIKQALKHDISKVVGCLVSHQHGDHAKYVKDIQDVGIQIIANAKVFETKILSSNYKIQNAFSLNEKMEISGAIETWTIIPFPVVHDVFTHGFLIHHNECGNVLFVTDTMELNYTFSNLNQIIIEANFSESILSKLNNESANKYVDNRVRNSHLSLEKCHEFLQRTDLSEVENIVLIHLSARNSHKMDFLQSTVKLTHKKVTVAEPNQTINFNKSIF
jgi:phosphoribosyl 1,2-cyclic phosphodiesterase